MLFLFRVVSEPVNDVSFDSSLIARAPPPIHLKDPKRGLSFHNTDYLQNWGEAGSQVSWAYNWDSSMPAAFPKNLEYIPMLWSDDEEHTNQVGFAPVF